MIPKVIHYCWFGNNPIPKSNLEYMNTWKKYCKGYEIKRWNESNFDVEQNQYCREAYQNKKWAFVSDYARLKILYDHGGIYLDTDVEVLRDLTVLISSGKGYIGFQDPEEINTGLGFAAEAHNPCVGSMLKVYEKRKFLLQDGGFNLVPCPAANTVGLQMRGLKTGEFYARKIQHLDGITVYPTDYFNPYNFNTCKMKITKNTFTIHHYSYSWSNTFSKKKQLLKKIVPSLILSCRARKKAKKDIRKIYRELQNEK